MATAAATTQARRTALGADRAAISQMQTFAWVGTDKRGVKMRGEEVSKNENLV